MIARYQIMSKHLCSPLYSQLCTSYTTFSYIDVYESVDMRKSEASYQLENLAYSQWGMFTAAQATALGLQRNQIARLVSSGKAEPMCYGVYRFLGGEDSPTAGIKAAWLSLFPEKTAYERLSERPYDAVVAGRTAATLLGGGDFYATPFCFIAPQKRGTKRIDIELIGTPIEETDIVMIDTLPVACAERTVADLIRCDEDLSLIRGFLRDMLIQIDCPVDATRLATLLAPLAASYGFSKHDGESFARELMRKAFDQPAKQGVGSALKNLLDRFQAYADGDEHALDFLAEYIASKSLSEQSAGEVQR